MTIRNLLLLMMISIWAAPGSAKPISAGDYDSIQEAIDSNPGSVIYIPGGRYEIDRTLHIKVPGSGLYGSGTIVQTNRDHSVIRVENADFAHVSGLTLTRTEEAYNGTQEGIVVINSRNVVVDDLRVIENRSKSGAITFRGCVNSTIRDCVVENYKCIIIDDRTNEPDLYGYSFRCMDGTGIQVRDSTGTMIRGNRVLEYNFLPTKEIRDQYGLGQLTERLEKRGRMTSEKIWESGYTNNWHQGSGIYVGSATSSKSTILADNYIENPGQGIDIHSDNVIVSGNMINRSLMGMKAIHGSQYVLIDGNQFIAPDIKGVLLGPGTSSSAARGADDPGGPAPANVDGGSILSHNIAADFGHGGQKWNWPGGRPTYLVSDAPLPRNPPIRDVIVEGNLAYDSGRDGIIIDGEPRVEEPINEYAFRQGTGQESPPQNVIVSDNLFNPGYRGAQLIED